MKVVDWAMKLAPYAVFGLLCNITIKIGFDAISSMSMYVLTVILGLLLLLCFYLTIVYFVANIKPLDFLSKIREVQLMAFSTSSSAAVMPLSMKTAEDKLNVPTSISKFVIPLGATVNMDGTALYQVCAAIFLTQLYGLDLSLVEVVILALTTVGASIGAPSTPGVGIVILATILQGIGVPVEGIALILGVDRILDMCRTTINVTGDLTATLVMKKLTGFSNTSEKSANNLVQAQK
jgi:proton glutamate symport protein